MLGWFRAEADRASFSKRLRRSWSDGQRLRQHLDRHLAPEPRVPRPVHLAHPARAERREDLVGAEASPGGERQRSPIDAVDDVEVVDDAAVVLYA